MADTEIVVDKMHFKGHIDQWCKRVYNPYNFPELEKVKLSTIVQLYFIGFFFNMQVDTEVCEQTFSWLSRYACITRHMNGQHFLFYIMYISDLHNRRKEALLK